MTVISFYHTGSALKGLNDCSIPQPAAARRSELGSDAAVSGGQGGGEGGRRGREGRGREGREGVVFNIPLTAKRHLSRLSDLESL